MENPSEMGQETVGTRRGDYEILGLLGAGGMGQVYKVRNVYSDRIEAMKVLLPNLADQKNLADRFVREIKVLAGLHHPNIAELRTALTINNQLVMIMEYVEGATLAARVQQGAIPYGQALGYIEQALSALSYAHKQSIIHRDIKPANMMLTPDGVVKLMDFGIAQRGDQAGLTMTNTTLGSLSYMSPEQIKGESVDARSDLYSVGVSLYEMVTGQRPFQADTAFSAMQAHLQTPARPPIELRPDLPPAISSLILMSVSKDPALRFQSASAFSTAIASVAPRIASTAAAMPAPAVSPVPAPGPVAPTRQVEPMTQQSPMPPPAAQPTHRGLYITLGAVIVLVILVVGGLYVPQYARTHAFGHRNASPAPAVAAPAADTPAPNPAPAAPSSPDASAQPAAPAPPPAAPVAEAPKQSPAAPAPPPGPDPKELEALRDEGDQLSSRAAAVNASIENLQRQQAAQGYGLRGDIVASRQRMESDMARAQSAIQAKDVDSAHKYLDLAGAEAEKLEQFLGR